MARSFGGASNQYLQALNAVLATAQPFTISAFVVSASYGPTQPIYTSPENIVFQMDANILLLHCANWLSSGAVLTNGVVFHASCGANGGSSALFKDGVQLIGGNSGGNGFAGNHYIGGRTFAGSFFLNGRMCEVAIWAAALTSTEIRALAKGVSPKVVRPFSLKGYWPLWGTALPEPDLGPSKIAAASAGGSIPAAQHMVGSPMAL